MNTFTITLTNKETGQEIYRNYNITDENIANFKDVIEELYNVLKN